MNKKNTPENMIHSVGIAHGRMPTKGPMIRIMHQLSQDAYLEYKEATRVLRAGAQSDQFRLVSYAYDSFIKTTKIVELEFEKNRDYGKLVNLKLALNADFLSFLGMMRLFLDHTETTLKHFEDQKEYEVFRKATNHEYDKNFSYRFSYKLRNYTQHCGFPIQNIQSQKQLIDNNKTIGSNFSIDFNRDLLLKKYDGWGTVVRKDLESQAELFPVVPIASELMHALSRIHQKTYRASLPRLVKCAKIVQAIADLNMEKSTPPSIISIPKDTNINDKSLNISIERIPLDLVAIINLANPRI